MGHIDGSFVDLRLLDADVAREFLLEVVEQDREQRLLSEEHFSVDGMLLETWATVRNSRHQDEHPASGEDRIRPLPDVELIAFCII